MHIAFDIDDTITRRPQFFAVISMALLAAGHRVCIISYREDRGFAEEDLAECGIEYDELVSPSEREWLEPRSSDWRTAAAQWKADVCRRLAIDIIFEDMPEVINALDAGTVAFMAVNPSLGILRYDPG